MGVAFKGNLAIAELLLSAGANPSYRNSAGQTPLMMAALFNRRAIIDVLLQAGAKLDAIDTQGNNAASLALGQGNQELANLLVCKGDDGKSHE